MEGMHLSKAYELMTTDIVTVSKKASQRGRFFTCTFWIGVTALVLSAAPALEGADWKLVSRSGNGVPLYYDAEGIQGPSEGRDTVRVRTKAVFSEAETPVAGLEEYTHSIGLLEIDCSEKMFIVREVVVYDRDGKTLTAYSPGWGYVPPEPQLEKLFGIVCPPRQIPPPVPKAVD